MKTIMTHLIVWLCVIPAIVVVVVSSANPILVIGPIAGGILISIIIYSMTKNHP